MDVIVNFEFHTHWSLVCSTKSKLDIKKKTCFGYILPVSDSHSILIGNFRKLGDWGGGGGAANFSTKIHKNYN